MKNYFKLKGFHKNIINFTELISDIFVFNGMIIVEMYQNLTIYVQN